MKKVREIVENPKIKERREGFMIMENIDGREKRLLKKKQRMTRVLLLNIRYQFMNTSEIHQKLGTFS